MKPISFILASLLVTSSLQAQAPAGEKLPAVKARIKTVEVQEQPTPQFDVSNIKMKRWEPKNWIELDVEFEIKVPESAGGRKGTYGSLQLNVYVALQQMSKENKREVITGTLDLIDIPADQPCHALAYISPASLKAIFMKDNVTASSDIQGWGVELVAEGKVIASKSSLGNKPWWESKEALALLDGLLLNKMQTPFANVFGDYDVPVKAK